MADIHDAAARSRNMAAIRAKDTGPEMLIRRALHGAGFRYRLHVRELPGRPDLVLPGHRAAIFINGCFWHRHECARFRWPATRRDFWRAKLDRNAASDIRALDALHSSGWRVAVIWECALRGRSRRIFEDVLADLVSWIRSDRDMIIIAGQTNA